MKLTLFLFLSGLAMLANAQEQGQSIMLQNQPNQYNYLTTEPKPATGPSLGDKCMQMSRKIDQLKGKPQQRYALMQQYQVECQPQDVGTINPEFDPTDLP
ncbi:MAG: hypothetical protein PVG22_18080 [Chromatiales bacterium]|jgi:hypothetical protein